MSRFGARLPPPNQPTYFGIVRTSDPVRDTVTKPPAVTNGYVCARCNCRNEYAGPEHLKNGVYICYECK